MRIKCKQVLLTLNNTSLFEGYDPPGSVKITPLLTKALTDLKPRLNVTKHKVNSVGILSLLLDISRRSYVVTLSSALHAMGYTAIHSLRINTSLE